MYVCVFVCVCVCVCVCACVRACVYIGTSAVNRLILINSIQKKVFLHNICVCTVYICVYLLCIYIKTHTCMYIFQKK